MAPFRILCLHGQGVNANIFRTQTVPLRSMLPSNYDYVFLDGPHSSDPAPGGVADVYPDEKYTCWYTSPSTRRVNAAHEYVKRAVKRLECEGKPIRGVMGFSQGAALAASLILHQQIAGEQPLFEIAIFICSPVPFSKSIQYGIDTRTYFGLKADVSSRPSAPNEIPDYLITHKAYLNGEEEEEEEEEDGVEDGIFMGQEVIDAARYEHTRIEKSKEPFVTVQEISLDSEDESDRSTPASPVSVSDSDTSASNLDDSLNSLVIISDSKLEKPSTFYQMFFPTVDNIRIRIPTAHIYGREDSWRRHSMCLVELCEEDHANVYQHQGGHVVPGATAIEDVEGMCDVIETVVASVDV